MISSNSHIKYARALYSVASRQDVDANARVLADLEALTAMFADERFRNALKKISWLEKSQLEKIVTETFKPHLHGVSLNLLVLLGRSGKFRLIPRIFDAYSHVFHQAKKIVELKVRSARKLNSDEELALIEKLQQKLDKPVSVRFEQNANLIGGVQIFERGSMTDYSLQNYLETLKKHLLSHNF